MSGDGANVIPMPQPRRRRSIKGIPQGLPFTALGVDGRMLYILDSLNLLVVIPRDRISRAAIVGVWGEHQEELYKTYGRYRVTKDGEFLPIPRSIHADHAADDMQRMCSAAGYFDSLRRLRGAGAWRGEDDSLVLHLGDKLWIPAPEGRAPATMPLGRHGEHIYLRRATLPPPYGRPVSPEIATELHGYLASWKWERRIDPMLVLGVIAAGFLAGALAYRPQVDITGEPGVGKSGVQQVAWWLLGDRMLYLMDATAAGVRQRTGWDALCVGLDENESGGDPRRTAELAQLRRASYGEGGESLRGSVDHVAAASFPLRSIYLSSAVTLPPADAASRSRSAVARLIGPPNGSLVYRPAASEAGLNVVGTMLLRRLTDHWRRLDAEVIPAWRRILSAHGFDGRASATYGTLLGCAWVLLSDQMPTEKSYEEYEAELYALRADDTHERVRSYERLTAHLMAQWVEPALKSGRRMSALFIVLRTTGYGETEAGWKIPEQHAIINSQMPEAKEAARELADLGMCIINSHTGARLLAFSNTSPWIERALVGTPFASLPGRAGGHSATLLQVPGARRVDGVRFNHGKGRGVAVPLAYMLRGMVGPDAERSGAIWDNMHTGDPLAFEE